MTMKTLHRKPELVRTTVRLSRQTFQRLKTLSLDEDAPIQTIVDQAIRQYDRRTAKRRLEEFFKPEYMVKLKKGQRLPTRAELYDEVLDHRVRLT